MPNERRHIQVMRAEDIVAMAKDAARYRWLREAWRCTIAVECFDSDAGEEAQFDAVVDAQMKEEQE